MPPPIANSLLALADAVDKDGGRAVCHKLAALLREAAPFDAAEMVLRREDRFLRFALGDDVQPVAGEDLIEHVLTLGLAVRVDDLPELRPYPRARDMMSANRLRSLLAIPTGKSVAGVLVVGRRHGWSFAGASLHFLEPIAVMAGIALDRSLALTARAGGGQAQPELGRDSRVTALTAEVVALRAQVATGASETESLQRAHDGTRDELAHARAATRAAQSAHDQAVRRCHELEARLAAPHTIPDALATPPSPETVPEAATPPEPPEPASDVTPPPAATVPVESVAGASVAGPAMPAPSSRRRRRRKAGFEPPADPSRS